MSDYEALLDLGRICQDIVSRHTPPRDPSNAAGPLLCTYCGRAWPCPDRLTVGTLLPDPSNHLLRHLTGPR